MTTEKKGFHPLETTRLNLKELHAGRIVPTAPVAFGAMIGSPVAVILVGALTESGWTIGPQTAALIGIGVSAVLAYFTRAGRRQVGDRANDTGTT